MLKANEAGAPRRKRTCPRLLSSVPQRGLNKSNKSTLIQGINERIRLIVPSCRLSGLFISELYLRYRQVKRDATTRADSLYINESP